MNSWLLEIHRLPLKAFITKNVKIIGQRPHIRVLQTMGNPAVAILVDLANFVIWRNFIPGLNGSLIDKGFSLMSYC